MVIAHSWPQVTTVGPSLVTFAVAVRVFNVLAVAEHFDPLKWHRDIENCEAAVKKKKIADIHSISVSSALCYDFYQPWTSLMLWLPKLKGK